MLAPELHLLILWTHMKFLKMRTENVSGAHFIYCQCGCSQLMLQTSHMSLEKHVMATTVI